MLRVSRHDGPEAANFISSDTRDVSLKGSAVNAATYTAQGFYHNVNNINELFI